MKENFLKRITSKPPILFPMVALFHVGLLLYNIYTFADEPLWTQMFWLLSFTISWIFVCDMKQWAAMVYIGLTTLNLMLRFFLKSEISLSNYTDALFPADVLFTFFLMFYFKRFD
jgi:hypothetical protein